MFVNWEALKLLAFDGDTFQELVPEGKDKSFEEVLKFVLLQVQDGKLFLNWEQSPPDEGASQQNLPPQKDLPDNLKNLRASMFALEKALNTELVTDKNFRFPVSDTSVVPREESIPVPEKAEVGQETTQSYGEKEVGKRYVFGTNSTDSENPRQPADLPISHEPELKKVFGLSEEQDKPAEKDMYKTETKKVRTFLPPEFNKEPENSQTLYTSVPQEDNTFRTGLNLSPKDQKHTEQKPSSLNKKEPFEFILEDTEGSHEHLPVFRDKTAPAPREIKVFQETFPDKGREKSYEEVKANAETHTPPKSRSKRPPENPETLKFVKETASPGKSVRLSEEPGSELRVLSYYEGKPAPRKENSEAYSADGEQLQNFKGARDNKVASDLQPKEKGETETGYTQKENAHHRREPYPQASRFVSVGSTEELGQKPRLLPEEETKKPVEIKPSTTGTENIGQEQRTEHIEEISVEELRARDQSHYQRQEVKYLRVRFEDAHLRFKLQQSYLQVEINLKEELQNAFTYMDLHRLAKSLETLGLSLEGLKVNGMELVGRNNRNAKREDKDRFNIKDRDETVEKTGYSPSYSTNFNLLL